MWQIMWVINLIPEGVLSWIINLMLLLGVLGYFSAWIGKFVPGISQYAVPVRIAGIVLFCLGLFFKGGEVTELAWRAKAEALQAQVKESEEKSKDANVVIQKVFVDRIKTVKQVQVVIKERIVKDAGKIDAECKVAPEAISILNDSAKLRKGTVDVELVPTGGKK